MSTIKSLPFSDIFLTANDYSFRSEGDLVELEDAYRTDADQLYQQCLARKGESDDFDLQYDGVLYRGVHIDDIHGDCYVLRRLANRVLSWRELYLPNTLLKASLYQRRSKELITGGIIFIFGETDSGKSTTLNALIDHMANLKSWLFMSFEDPVEVRFSNDYPTGARIIQRHTPPDQLSQAMKSALRANADVIKVSEIRDSESALTAIDAALTGHTVLASLHAAGIPEGLSRFSRLLGDSNSHLVSQALRCCIHQRLGRHEGFQNRSIDLKFLMNTDQVKPTITDQNFNGLRQYIEQHTKKILES